MTFNIFLFLTLVAYHLVGDYVALSSFTLITWWAWMGAIYHLMGVDGVHLSPGGRERGPLITW